MNVRITIVALLLSCSLAAHGAAQNGAAPQAPKSAAAAQLKLGDTLPVSPLVRKGQLANGLTYYVHRNARPENKLELRLVVKAGSILEDDDQQGLAHFTEHMAFNGSTHFKRNELVSYLQSIGVKFGADLNAYTSFDETVYILPIPTDRREVVEQGFQVLEDWAHGLSFNDADIDSERGIVLEELRIGKGVDDRMNKVLMPKMLNGSRYAERLPIGKEQVIRNFSYDAIKRFYRDWYRPDLMAVVAVGDIDPDEAQRLIERHFGKLKNPANPRPRTYATIPARQHSEGLVFTDPEMSANMVYIHYPVQPWVSDNTLADYRQKLLESMCASILNQRMAELTQQDNPPFLQGGSGMSKVVRGYRWFGAAAVLGKGGVEPAIHALVTEDRRARQFGFTASEIERAKKAMLRSYENMYQERDKSDSAGYAAEYIRNFLEDETIPGVAAEYQYAQQLIPGITLAEVNAVLKSSIPDQQSKLVAYTGTDKPGQARPTPTAEQLLALTAAAEKIPVQAQQDKAYARQLMATPPAAGSIVQQTTDDKLGTTELVLSNGVRVVLKPTDFNNDEVLLAGLRFGGWSLFDDKDMLAAQHASSIVNQMGVLTYSPTELGKILAGKSVSSAAGFSALNEVVRGESGRADIESMLQLAYLQMTAPRKDATLYNAYIERQRELAQNNLARPEAMLSDTVTATLYGNSPRVPRRARPADFEQLSLDRVFDLYTSRLANARDFTFFLVGSFDIEQVKPLIATYLASLPTGPATTFRDDGVRPVRGVVKKEVHAGTEQKSVISLSFTGAAAYSRDARLALQAMTEVLNIKLIEVLREQMGVVYSASLQGSLNRLPYENYAISATLPCAPENVDKVLAATFAEIDKVKQQGVQQADLDKVKAAMLRNYRKGMRENDYWIGSLQNAYINGTDPQDMLRFEKRLAALTPQDLQQAAQRYFDLQNYVQVVLKPQAQ